MNTITRTEIPYIRLFLHAALWLAQVLLAGLYLSTGLTVLFLPAAQVLAIAPWAVHLPGEVLKFVGAVDLATGFGVLLPSLTRVAPRLTVLAAVCSAWLQVFAIFFYVFLGTLATMLPVNLAVLALSVFVAWGRSEKASITPRWQDPRMSAVDAFVSEPVDRSQGRSKARRRRPFCRRKSRGNEGFRFQRGLRDAPFHRANARRKFCNE